MASFFGPCAIIDVNQLSDPCPLFCFSLQTGHVLSGTHKNQEQGDEVDAHREQPAVPQLHQVGIQIKLLLRIVVVDFWIHVAQ